MRPELQPVTRHVSVLRLRNAARSTIYVVREDGGDTLVDPGPVGAASAILALDRAGALRLRRIVLTHAHPAHAGAAARVSRGTGVSVHASAAEAPFLDGRAAPLLPRGGRGRLLEALGLLVPLCPPIYRLEPLVPGQPLGDLLPIATPGHAPGHVALLHRRDRVLLCGDAVLSAPRAGRSGATLRLPSRDRAHAPAAARAALATLARLDFDVLCPGHGPPVTRGAHAALQSLITRATG